MLVTSNRAVSEWGSVFGDAVVAAVILDRLLHHSHVMTIRDDSYRPRAQRTTCNRSMKRVSSWCRPGFLVSLLNHPAAA